MSCEGETSKYFLNNTTSVLSKESNVSIRFLEIENNLVWKLNSPTFGVTFSCPVEYIYNPLDYASEVHSNFVNTYCNGKKKLLILGMNPGPWGMMQTGVPFGEVSAVRDWLKLSGNIRQPENQHPCKRVLGFDCKRSEVSGTRFWSLARQLSQNDPYKFFNNAFIYNYFPLVLISRSAKNITPEDLKPSDQREIQRICDESLLKVLELLGTEIIIAVGRYAEKKATVVLKENNINNIKVIFIPHPSPRNPGNKNWVESTLQQLNDLGLSKNEMENWMQEALCLAEGALKNGEVPVGCIFIYNDKIIAQGSNTVNETHNATRHAEMNCIDDIIKAHEDDWQTVLNNTHVVVTVEPCIMCASALHMLRVASITYGCANDRFGGCKSVLNTSTLYENPTPVTGNIYADEAMALLKQFYKGTNPNAPEHKVKVKKLL